MVFMASGTSSARTLIVPRLLLPLLDSIWLGCANCSGVFVASSAKLSRGVLQALYIPHNMIQYDAQKASNID